MRSVVRCQCSNRVYYLKMLRITLFSCLFLVGLCEPQSRLVNLVQGPVRGYKDLEEDIYVFYSIPYATAPTGPDRFQAPLLPPIWTKTFEAIDKKIICPQSNIFNFIDGSKVIQEDCLIANIYVPETDELNLPVVVYVHGGTEDVPGNAGMKDQVALLRWVKQNIKRFGGNPNEITIAGYSAGSSSVDLLLMSKMTDGLFKRVIPESGASTAAFSVQTNPIKNAKEYAKILGFENVDDIYDLESFFKTVPYDMLNSVNTINRTDSTFLMSPCVERDLGLERFLEDSPVNILKSGNFKKLPILFGFANMEGLFRAELFDNWKDEMNKKFSDFLPADLNFKDDAEREKVAERIKRFYFGEKEIENSDILAYIDYFTDVIFAYPTLRSVKYQVEAGNNQIYLYEYSYFTDNTPAIPYTNLRGANHCAQTAVVLDNYYWNGTIVKEKEISEDLKEMKRLMREFWLNFMISGIPQAPGMPIWEPVGADWSPHMSLNRTVQLKGSLLKERSLFWESIYEQYYQTPLSPLPTRKHIEL